MLAADLMRCAVVAALTVLALRGLSSAAALGPPTALLGAGEGLFLPASFAIMPTLLPAGQLAAGNAVSAALVQVGSMAGPVLGGAVVAAAGSAPAFAVDAATFAVSALTLALLRPRRLGQEPGLAAATTREAAADGQGSGLPPAGLPGDPAPGRLASGADGGAAPGLWALLRRERILQVILVMAVMANLAGAGTFAVALPALAHAEFGAGGYGALIACVGAGTVAGTVGAARGTRLRRPAITACGCLLGFAAATALVPILGGLPGACAALAVVGAANGFCNVIVITMLQRWAPRRLLGRVMSLVVLAAMGTYPVSVVVTGALIRSTGPRPFFPIAGAAVAAAVVFALAQREVRDFSVPAEAV
jgi:MFS family permease